MRYFTTFTLITTAIAASLTPTVIDCALPQLQSLWQDIRENSTSSVEFETHLEIIRNACCSDAARKLSGDIDPLCSIKPIQKRAKEMPDISKLEDFCSKTAYYFSCMPGFSNNQNDCYKSVMRCCKQFGLDPNHGLRPDPICLPYIKIAKYEGFGIPTNPGTTPKRQSEYVNCTAEAMECLAGKYGLEYCAVEAKSCCDVLPERTKSAVCGRGGMQEVKARLNTFQARDTKTTLAKRGKSLLCTAPYFTSFSCCKYDLFHPLRQHCESIGAHTLPLTVEAAEKFCGYYKSPACCPRWGGDSCLPILYPTRNKDIFENIFNIPPFVKDWLEKYGSDQF